MTNPTPRPTPLPYQRVMQEVRDQIRLGRLRPHEKLPPAKTMAETHGVAIGTVERAMRELRTEGVVYSVVGTGTFVAEHQPDDAPDLALRVAALESLVREMGHRLDALESTRE